MVGIPTRKQRAPRRTSRGTYWITRPDQLSVLASAVRMDIIDRLVAVGPMSVKDIALWTGKRPTPIYHHLQRMERVGLVRSTQIADTPGRPAALYEAVGRVMRLARAPLAKSNRKSMARIGRIVAGQAAKDYALGFHSPVWKIAGPAKNHWVFRCVARPSPKRLGDINALLGKLAELIWTPEPTLGKISISVAWFMSALDTPLKGPKVKKKRR